MNFQPDAEGRIHIFIEMQDSNLVQQLKAHCFALETETGDLQTRLNRAEYLYRCECVINGELTDLCKANGIRFRPGLFAPKGKI